MANRAELIIQLTGDKDALRSLSSLKSAADSLNKHKISLDFDKNNIRVQINDVRREMESIRSVARDLGVKPTDLQTYRDLQDRLTSLNQEMRRLQQESQLDSAGVRALNDQMNTLEASAQRTADAFSAIGNALISLGSVSEGIGNFAAGIGQAFTGMASIFQTNIIDNVERMLTYMATRGITGSLGNAIGRYDILNTFEQYMELAGVQANVAERSLKRVNDAILGLPIGLDEAAQRLRRYQMFLGDVERATNLTIGVQNALFAGGANEAARTTAYYQIDRLLTVGRLNTARQWNALLMGMGVSVRYVAEEMGYSFSNISDFAKGLSSGAISTDEFLRSLERLGTGSTEAGQKLQRALDIYKSTVDSWMRNISFAFQRGTANIMSALDETLEQASGRGITGYMERFRNAVNRFYAGGVSVLQDNPEIMAQGLGSIERLIDAFSRFSGNELAVNVLQNLARFVDMLAQALNRLPVGATEQFVAFAVTLAGPLGKLFATISSGLPVVLGVFQRFKDFDFEELLDKIMTQVERLASVVSGLLNLIPDGLMGDLIAFGLVWGKPLATALSALGSAVKGLGLALTAPSVAGAFAEGGFFAGLVRLAAAYPMITALVAAIGGLAYVINDTINETEKAQRAYADSLLASVGHIDPTAIIATSKASVEGIRSMREEWDKSLDEINATSLKADEISKQIASLDTQIADASGAELERLISQREVAYQKLQGLGIELSPEADVAQQVAKWRADAQVEHYRTVIAEALRAEATVDSNLASLRRQRDEARANLEDLRRQREEARKTDPQFYQRQISFDQSIEDAKNAYIVLERQVVFQEIARNILEGNIDAASEALVKVKEVQEAVIAAGGLISAEDWVDIREEVSKTIEKQLSGYDEMEKFTAKPLGDMIKGLDSQAEAARQYTDSIEAVMDYIARTGRTDLLGIIQGWGESGLDAAPLFMGLAESITNGGEEAIDEFVKSTNEHLKEKMKSEAFAGVLAAAADGFDEGEVEFLKEQYGALGEEMLNAIFSAFNRENVREKAIEAITGLRKAAEESRIETLITRTQSPVGSGEIPDELKMEAIAEMRRNPFGLRRSRNEAAENEVDGYEKIQEASTEAADTIVKDAKRSSDSLEDVERSVNRTADTFDDRRSSVDNMSKSMDDLARQANAVSRMIDAVREALDRLQDKEINLTVNTVENITTNAVGGVVSGGVTGGVTGGGGRPGGPTPLPYATGGFLPRGTDTIAALLSPGEFVMRKGAVDAVGGAFLSRLNSLDIRGAIDSMMSRYYRPSSVATATSYTTNSYDNRNITVNQNVRTNNPRYANRRIMSRFAHAL